MKFESSPAFAILVNQAIGSLKGNSYVILPYILGGCFFLYKLNPHFDVALIIGEILLPPLLLLIVYLRTVPIGKIINNTANEIVFLEDSISIKTVPVKILFWINKPSMELNFKIRHFRISKTPYPAKNIYDLDKKVWMFSMAGNEIYIIPDFFDKELEQKIKLFI